MEALAAPEVPSGEQTARRQPGPARSPRWSTALTSHRSQCCYSKIQEAEVGFAVSFLPFGNEQTFLHCSKAGLGTAARPTRAWQQGQRGHYSRASPGTAAGPAWAQCGGGTTQGENPRPAGS